MKSEGTVSQLQGSSQTPTQNTAAAASKKKYDIEVELDDDGTASSVIINNTQIEPQVAIGPAFVTQCHDNTSSPWCTKRVIDTSTGNEVYRYNTTAACPIPQQCARF